MTTTGRTGTALLTALLMLVPLALPATAQTPSAPQGASVFTPALVEQTLAPGQQFQIAKTLHAEKPAKVDVVLALDSTGTMGDALDDAKAGASAFAQSLAEQFPGGWRISVVDFRDYDFSNPGSSTNPGTGGTYPYWRRTPLTNDLAAVQNALNGLSTGTGGSSGEPDGDNDDGDEGYNRVFFEAANDPGLEYDPQAARALVVFGDRSPRDTASAFDGCRNAPSMDPGRNGVLDGLPPTGDDINTANAIQGLRDAGTRLFMVDYDKQADCYSQLSEATGGRAFEEDDADFPALAAEIGAAAGRPQQVSLQVEPADCPLQPTFSPAGPWGPFDGPVDIAFTEMVTAPAQPGTYECQVFGIVDGAQVAVQQLRVTVPEPEPIPTTTTEPTPSPTPTPTASPSPLPVEVVNAGGQLPFTGSFTLPVMFGALLLIVGGGSVLFFLRRKRGAVQ